MKFEIKVTRLLLIIALIVTAVFFINKSFAVNNAKVNVETANLRETADSNAKILEQLSLNDSIEILEKKDGWYKVKAKGITGYLREDLVKEEKEEATQATTAEPETNEVEETKTNTENTEIKETTNTEEKEETNKKETTQKKVTEDTKLKIVPAINATEIIEVKKDEEVTITEKINGWVCIETKTTKGWIRENRLKDIEEENKQEEKKEEEQQEEKQAEQAEQKVLKTLYVSKQSINLRKEANTNSEIVTTLPVNMAVEVYEELNGWSKVKVSGKEGYILSSLLSDKKQETSRGTETTRKKAEEDTQNTPTSAQTTTSAPVSGNAGSVVSTAQSYVGRASYVYGASGPNSFDCSGFTSYIYRQYGVNLNRTAAGQYSNGTAVSRSDLQPGDLVMFGGSASSINHVGIYMGGGQIVHAANPSRGVTVDTINSGYYNNNYVGARRVM